jgi:CTP synthase
MDRIEHPKGKVRIGLFGKYVDLPDAYLSVIEALKAGGYAAGAEVEIVWVASDEKQGENHEGVLLPHLTSNGLESIESLDGVLVPGGFGIRGIEGKIEAVRIARERGIPFLGLCLGLQCAVIEYARNVAGLAGANSCEFDEMTPHPVIDLLPGQEEVYEKGGSMRLGLWPARLWAGTKAQAVYGKEVIYERHRHRYEVNSAYHSILQDNGLVFSGTSPDGRLVEIIELSDHPFFMASQFHPEFLSRPNRAHPLFEELVAAAVKRAVDRGSFALPPAPGASADPVPRPEQPVSELGAHLS